MFRKLESRLSPEAYETLSQLTYAEQLFLAEELDLFCAVPYRELYRHEIIDSELVYEVSAGARVLAHIMVAEDEGVAVVLRIDLLA